MNGADKIGLRYMVQAVAMAHDLRLFKASSEVKSKKMRDARDLTAWALFVVQAYVKILS